MKINVEENNGKSFSIKFPNWLIFTRLGISFAAKNIVKNGNLGISIQENEEGCEENTEINEYGYKEEYGEKAPLDKKEFKKGVKKMKRALISARKDLRAFLKRNPDFVLVDVEDEDGDCVKITL